MIAILLNHHYALLPALISALLRQATLEFDEIINPFDNRLPQWRLISDRC